MPLDTRSWLSQQRMVPFRYAGAGTVPAFGVLEITDVEKNEFDGGVVLLAQQPTSTAPNIVAINSGYIASPNSNAGIATGICSFDFPTPVKTDSGYTNDVEIGPVSGQWYMDSSGSGFRSMGDLNAGLVIAGKQPTAISDDTTCQTVVTSVTFDSTTCTLTVTTKEICFPKGSKVTIDGVAV